MTIESCVKVTLITKSKPFKLVYLDRGVHLKNLRAFHMKKRWNIITFREAITGVRGVISNSLI